MQRLVLVLVAFFVSAGLSAAEETQVLLHPSSVPPALLPGIVEDGRILVGGPQIAPLPGISGGLGPATDLIMGPALNQRPFPMQPAYPRPVGELVNRPPDLNRLNAFFSSASGGFGFRMAFDRRLSSTLRFTAGPEFLTYGLQQSLAKLGGAIPEGVTRITLMSIPVGFQRQFAAQDRVVPHIGFGVGPIVRFDHRARRDSTPAIQDMDMAREVSASIPASAAAPAAPAWGLASPWRTSLSCRSRWAVLSAPG